MVGGGEGVKPRVDLNKFLIFSISIKRDCLGKRRIMEKIEIKLWDTLFFFFFFSSLSVEEGGFSDLFKKHIFLHAKKIDEWC